MNKKSVLITPGIIEECLCESLDSLERVIPHIEKIIEKVIKITL